GGLHRAIAARARRVARRVGVAMEDAAATRAIEIARGRAVTAEVALGTHAREAAIAGRAARARVILRAVPGVVVGTGNDRHERQQRGRRENEKTNHEPPSSFFFPRRRSRYTTRTGTPSKPKLLRSWLVTKR